MHESKQKQANSKSQVNSQTRDELQAEESFLHQEDSLVQQLSGSGNIPNASVHAQMLSRIPQGQIAANPEFLHHIQQQYGNSHVSQVVQMARESRGKTQQQQVIQAKLQIDAPQRSPLPPQQLPQNPATANTWGMGMEQSAIRSSISQRITMPPIQAKLTIGQPNDKYEQEADRVAALMVQKLNAPADTQTNEGQTVQRQQPQEEDVIQAKPEITTPPRQSELTEKLQPKLTIQSQEEKAGGEASTDLSSAINSARGAGQPLDTGLQQSMEQAMGADFSGVRVHTDGQSDLMNRSINARAFTTGQDVFFRKGEYQPGSRGGRS